MGRSNLPGKGKTYRTAPTKKSSKLNKNLGVYTFVDEDGNVTQIKKVKKSITKFYPNEPSKVESIVGDYAVIGVASIDSGDASDIAMGVGDANNGVLVYAEYV